jgi:hypothetical protein
MSTKSRQTIYGGAIMGAEIALRARGKPPRRPSARPIRGGRSLVNPTETREITPYLWVHPDEQR